MPSPPPDASNREKRAYRRQIKTARAVPRYMYLGRQLEKAYEKYQHCVCDQNWTIQYDCKSEMIRDAMAKLSRLKTIELSLSCCLHNGRSRDWRMLLPEVCRWPMATRAARNPVVLHDCDHCSWVLAMLGRHFGAVVCNGRSSHCDVILKKLKHAVQCLRTLVFYITTRCGEDRDFQGFHHEKIPLCAEYLEDSGRLRGFITSASRIENLTFQFDCYGSGASG